MDENDLRGVADAMNELRESGQISADTLKKLTESTKGSAEAQKKFANELVQYGRQVSGAISSLSSGGGSFRSLAGSVDVTVKAFSTVAGQLGSIGKAFGFVATAFGEVAKVALAQLDDITKNYQALGDASAIATDGIDGLYRQFNQLGNYSLPAFTKAVRNNTLGLAALQGTAARGAEELSLVAGALTTGDVARRFIKLGISLDTVGDTAAEYIGNMSRYGLLQGNTTDELIVKTQNYIVEVDKIARLTGQTRAAQEQIARQNQADVKYRAKISDMRARGEIEQAQQLEMFVRGLGAINPALAENARATVTGTYLTRQAAESDIVLNGVVRRSIQAIEQGTSAADALADTQDSLAVGAGNFRTLLQYGGKDLGGLGVAAFDTEALLLRRNELEDQGLSRADAIAQAQKEQMEASGGLTEKITDAQLSAANASKNIQSLSFSLAAVASGPIKWFAEGLEKATGKINKAFGVGGTMMPGSYKYGAAGGPAGGSDVERMMSTIRSRESSGNYRAQSPTSSASGAYQFIDSTWQSLTKKYGIGGEFGKAKLAPKEIQDAIARAYVQDILKEAGGDVSKVPLAWYTGNIQGKISAEGLAANRGLTPETYQSNFMSDYNRISGPSSGYKSAGITNPASAGAETTAVSKQATSQELESLSFGELRKELKNLGELMRTNNAQNAKLIQLGKG